MDSVNTEATLTAQVPWIINAIRWCKSHLSHSFLHHPKGPGVLQPKCWLPAHHRSIMPQHHRPEAPWVLTAVPEVSELLKWLSALGFPAEIIPKPPSAWAALRRHTLSPSSVCSSWRQITESVDEKFLFRVADNADYVPPSHSLFHMGICWLINYIRQPSRESTSSVYSVVSRVVQCILVMLKKFWLND